MRNCLHRCQRYRAVGNFHYPRSAIVTDIAVGGKPLPKLGFLAMPVIVVGADTTSGEAILDGLVEPNREIRVFISDEQIALRMKDQGFKVALGDVSDESHVEAAATQCFTAILIGEAAMDDRERAFIDEPSDILAAWSRASSAAGVTRVIWVIDAEPPKTETTEVAKVDPADPNLVETVVHLDDAQVIS